MEFQPECMEIQPLGRPSRRKGVAQSEKKSHIYSNPYKYPFIKIGCQMSGFLACTHFNWHEKNTKGYGVGKKHV